MAFDSLEWRLVAKDEASATVEKVSRSFSDLEKASNEASSVVSKSSGGWADMAKGIFAGGVALEFAQKAMGAVKDAITGSIAEAAEYQRTQGQLSAALISTGGAAGVTLEQLNQMSGELSNLTGIDDDVISSVQAMQLTFTNITKETFPDVTRTALDMATAMNGGATPSADQLRGQMIQLGKALNDPKDGISALTRVGVTFNDQQKKQIDTMLKNNDVIGAQKMILGELSKEFGGSAEIAAATFEGRMNKLHNALGDVKKQIGLALMPTLSLFVDTVTDSTGKVTMNEDTMKTWQLRIYQAAIIIKGIIQTIWNFGKSIIDLGVLLFEYGKFSINMWIGIGKAIKDFGNTARVVFEAMKQAITGDFGGALETLKTGFKDTFSGAVASFGDLSNAASKFGNQMLTNFDPMDKAISEATNPTKFYAMVDSMNKAEKAAALLGGNGTKPVANLGDEAKKAGEKVGDAMKKVKDDYEKAVAGSATALTELENKHAQTSANIASKIDDLRGKLKELSDEYQKTTKDLNQTEAERVVEQEKKVADIRKQISEETAKQTDEESKATEKLIDLKDKLRVLEMRRNEMKPDASQSSKESLNQQIANAQKAIEDAQKSGGGNARLADLQEELKKEEEALKAYATTRSGLDAELTEARRRASLTEFERFMEDLNAKRTQEQTDYERKKLQLEEQVKQEETNLEREKVVYLAKRQIYIETQTKFQQFHDAYKKNLENMNLATQKNVDEMQKKLEQLQTILKAIESAKAEAGVAAVVGFEGQSGNQTAQPIASPASQNITVNLGGVTVQNEADERRLVDRITRQLQLSLAGSQ
jgi:hypothetical protein